MERYSLTFDEARRKNFENTLAKNGNLFRDAFCRTGADWDRLGIDVNGYPIDPKAVRFS